MNCDKKEEVPQREKRPEEWSPDDACHRVFMAEFGSCQEGVRSPYLEGLRGRVADWLDRIDNAIGRVNRAEKDDTFTKCRDELDELITTRVEKVKQQLNASAGRRLLELEDQLAKLTIGLAAAENKRLDLEKQVWLRVTPIETREGERTEAVRATREFVGLLDRRLQVLEKERKERLEEEAKDIKALMGLAEEPKP